MCVSIYWVFGAQINVEFPAKGMKQMNKEHFELEVKIGLHGNAESLHLCL